MCETTIQPIGVERTKARRTGKDTTEETYNSYQVGSKRANRRWLAAQAAGGRKTAHGSGPRAPTGIHSSSCEFGVRLLVWRQGRETQETAAGDWTTYVRRAPQIAGSGEWGTHGETSRARSRPPCFGCILPPASAGGPLRQAQTGMHPGCWEPSLGRARQRAGEREDSSAGHLGISGSGRHSIVGGVARAWAPRSGTSPPHHRSYWNTPPDHISWYTCTSLSSCFCRWVNCYFFQNMIHRKITQISTKW